MNGLSGSFRSPKGQLLNSSCDWLITVPEGKIIKLVFTGFLLESDRHPWGCPRDFVEVYDGNSSSSVRRGRFCGSVTPMNIYSTGRYIVVRLRTDNETSWHLGFTATFTAEETYSMQEYTLFHTYSDFHCEALSFASLIGRTVYFNSSSLSIFELKCEKNLGLYEVKTSYHGKRLNDFYSLIAMHQKTHFFAALNRWFFLFFFCFLFLFFVFFLMYRNSCIRIIRAHFP